ncbi:hypothetical protein, partial [Legionella nautarum]|uniref:hypothetical protein n=1 Tax=Legionella nautarum TaxID=45070 RepID=UPI001A93B803
MTVLCLLLATYATVSAAMMTTFEANSCSRLLRLANFAVYASTLLLPPELQDSLCSSTGSTFYSRTFTCKTTAPYPSAPHI